MEDHVVEVAKESLSNIKEESGSGRWVIGGSKVPKEEIVFFCQIAIITLVVLVGLINLCFQNGTESYWAAMVATGLASLLPAPKIKRRPQE